MTVIFNFYFNGDVDAESQIPPFERPPTPPPKSPAK